MVTQKFVSDIVIDALTQAKQRTAAPGSAANDTPLTLTVEDLNSAMSEYGVASKKPPYYG